jgi:hypothetical protein
MATAADMEKQTPRRAASAAVLIALFVASAAAVHSAAAPTRPPLSGPTALEAILLGLREREHVADSKLFSMKGLWRVTEEKRTGPNGWMNDLSRSYLDRTVVQRYAAFSDWRYHESMRRIEPTQWDRPSSFGYDGVRAWYQDQDTDGDESMGCRVGQRQSTANLCVVYYTGLSPLLGEPPHRLSTTISRGRPEVLRQERLGAHACHVVRVHHPERSTRPVDSYWIAPDLGYAVVKSLSFFHSPPEVETRHSFRRTIEYSEFKHMAGCIWLPTARCETLERQDAAGSRVVMSASKAEALSLKANIDIPSSDFEPPSVPKPPRRRPPRLE